LRDAGTIWTRARRRATRFARDDACDVSDRFLGPPKDGDDDDDDDGLVFYARKKTIVCSLAWNRRDGGRARRARGWIARRSLTRFYRAIGKIWILFFSSLVVKSHINSPILTFLFSLL